MIRIFVATLSVMCLASAHEVHTGQCPGFTPMAGFDWEKFSSGVWYVTEKFGTSGTCLTYEFKTDNLGFKSIEQINEIPYTNKLGIDNHYVYEGKLFTPQESKPANMIVRFPLNLIGSASFVVLDTDYDNYGLVCTCQDVNLYLLTAHRRSCSLLHRNPVADNSPTSAQMKKLLDSQVDDASHDFDVISHENCSYDTDKGFNINVDEILNGKEPEVMTEEEYDAIYGDYEGVVEVLSAQQLNNIKKIECQKTGKCEELQ